MIYFMRLIILLLLLLGFKNTFAVEEAYVGFIMFFDCYDNQSYQLTPHNSLPVEVKLMQKLYEGDVIGIKKTGCNMDLYVNETSIQLNYEHHPTYTVNEGGKPPARFYDAWLQVKNTLKQLISPPEKIVQGGIRGEETDPNSTALSIPLLEGYEAKLVAGKRTLFLNLVGRNPQKIYLYQENSNKKETGITEGQQVRFKKINFVAEKTYWVEVKDTEKKWPFQVISELPTDTGNSVSEALNDSGIPPDMKKMLVVLRLLQKADERSIWGLEAYQQLMELKDTQMKLPAKEILKRF